MNNHMTEAEWIKAQEEFEDDMTVKEFREAMEEPENGRKRLSMKYFMTEEEWIKAQEELEDDMTVKEFREAMEKIKGFEEIENKKPYELPYVDLF